MEEFISLTGTIQIKDGLLRFGVATRTSIDGDDDGYKPRAVCEADVSRAVMHTMVDIVFDKIEVGEPLHDKYTQEELDAFAVFAAKWAESYKALKG